MTNLELVPRDELIDELGKRFPTLIIGLHAPRGDGSSNRMVWFQGDPMIALGLCRMAEHEMVERIHQSEELDPENNGGPQ